MKKVQQVLENRIRIANQAAIDEEEKNRRFCRHDLAHLLDVARIAYIDVLENDIRVGGELLSKEQVYACALLHDIGRAEEYKRGVDHDEAGVDIAREILEDTDFDDDEKLAILTAIDSHRGGVGREELAEDDFSHDLAKALATVIRKADHESRLCFDCDAYSDCYWTEERKNNKIKV